MWRLVDRNIRNERRVARPTDLKCTKSGKIVQRRRLSRRVPLIIGALSPYSSRSQGAATLITDVAAVAVTYDHDRVCALAESTPLLRVPLVQL